MEKVILPRALKCIVFDWDGTLVSAKMMVHQAYLAAFQAIGSDKAVTWREEDTQAQNGQSPNSIFANTEIWGDKGAEARVTFYETYEKLQKTHPHLLKLYDGAEELLSVFKKQYPTARLVLLGAKTEALLQDEVDTMKLSNSFDLVLGATGNPMTDKPAAGAFNRATEGLNIIDKTSEVMYIGDNPKMDPAFAHSWGATPIIVQPGVNKNALKELEFEISSAKALLHHGVLPCSYPKNQNENS